MPRPTAHDLKRFFHGARPNARQSWSSIFTASFALALFACAGSPVPQPFPTPFQVIAHRGASAYAPENTIAAYGKARDLGVVDVELDIQLSKDDVVVLYHDSSLKEKTGVQGKVRDYEAADLLEVDIGAWFDRTHPEVEEPFTGTKLNTLAALFENFGDTFRYHVELKSKDRDLVALALVQIEAYGLQDRVRFTSFIYEQVVRARTQAPHIPTGLLVRDLRRLRAEASGSKEQGDLELQQQAVDRAVASGFDQVAFASEDLSHALVVYVQSQGLSIRAWRIKSDADMLRAIAMGTSGMTTNWPDRLIRELLKHKRVTPSL